MSVWSIPSILFRRNGLTRPDPEKPLHSYGLTDTEFAELEGARFDLCRSGKMEAGLLVLLLSEWAYRNATQVSGLWRIVQEHLGIQRGSDFSYDQLETGLRFWARAPIDCAGARWIVAILRESGFPQHFKTANFDVLLQTLVHGLGWNALAAMEPATRAAALEILENSADRVALLRAKEACAYLVDVFAEFAAYRNRLAVRDLLPVHAEQTIVAWLEQLPEEDHPLRHLNHFRGRGAGGRPPALLQLLLPSLRTIGDGGAPRVEIRWSMGDPEPRAILAARNDRIAASWIEALLPDASSARRITIGPALERALWIPLERQATDFVSASGSSPSWRLADVVGDRLAIARQRAAGLQLVDAAVSFPLPGPFVFDDQGTLVTGTTLRTGILYRLFTPPPSHDAAPNDGNRPATLYSLEPGSTVDISVGRRTWDYHFVQQPLDVDLTGTPWPEEGGRRPWIGWPRVVVREQHSIGREPISAEIGGRIYLLRFEHGAFRFPGTCPVPFDGIVRLTAGGAESRFRVSVVPSDTRFTLQAPQYDGRRRAALRAPGLKRVIVQRIDDSVTEVHKADAEGTTEFTFSTPSSSLPVSEVLYNLTLHFHSSPIPIHARLADRRSSLYINLRDARIVPGRFKDRAPGLQIDTARACVLRGSGWSNDQRFRFTLQSTRPDKISTTTDLPDEFADSHGDLAIPLADLLVDAKVGCRNELRIEPLGAASGAVYLLFMDTFFTYDAKRAGDAFGALRPGCQLQRPELIYRTLAVTAPWEEIREDRMAAGPEERVCVPIGGGLPGGRFGAPFDGERRVGFVRFLRDEPLGEDAAASDPLRLALATPTGLTLSLLRQQFETPDTATRIARAAEHLSSFDSDDGIRLLQLARLDGTFLAYLAMHDPESVVASDLRAIPVGAWVLAARIAGEEWPERLYGVQRLVPEWLILFDLLRHGVPTDPKHVHEIEQLVANMLDKTATGWFCEQSHSLGIRLGDECDNWRREVALGAPRRYDARVHDCGATWQPMRRRLESLTHGETDVTRILLAPCALATAAARSVLDPTLSDGDRRQIRSHLLQPRTRRLWDSMSPVSDAFYLEALLLLWKEQGWSARRPFAADVRRDFGRLLIQDEPTRESLPRVTPLPIEVGSHGPS